MKKTTKKILFFTTLALIIGAGVYLYVQKKNKNVGGKRADFIKDGFVYSVGTKAQAYPKKNGEFAGQIIETYKEDKSYWLANNTKGQKILLKKSEVKLF